MSAELMDHLTRSWTCGRNWRGTSVAYPSPSAGHLCQEERPGVVNAELLDFLSDWNG
ncbi:hypothetical protein [Streptomyces sp. NPDC002573]|uniref:hypothetical protein n=1 Tax=Streptomyces sp. NPDC002573 TaxID=3364651 RepID=UPI0036821EF6